MRAIILAAGRGSRLQQAAGDELPKCLLSFGGKTLLERHLDILRDAGVGEVVLALGYRPGPVRAELQRLGRGDVEIVMNPQYELGSVLTVHTAAAQLTRGGDVLVMDADVLYDPRIMEALVAGDSVDRLLIDRDFEGGDEPVKVCVKDGVPVEFRKRVADGLTYDTIGESVGFFRFREGTAKRFAAIVAGYIDSGRANLPHEEAIRDLLLEEPAPGSTRGVEHLDVADVTGLAWIEIDFPIDVERAASEILPQIETNLSIER
jgi:choline kinase